MEDFSRELENELKAHTRHAPVRRIIKRKLVFIDDNGLVKPAGWLKAITWIALAGLMAASFAAAAMGWMYVNGRATTRDLTQKIAAAEKRITQLIGEKEILMANLVISGAISEGTSPGQSSDVKKKGAETVQVPDKPVVSHQTLPVQDKPVVSHQTQQVPDKPVVSQDTFQSRGDEPVQAAVALPANDATVHIKNPGQAPDPPGAGSKEVPSDNTAADPVPRLLKVEGLKVSKDTLRNEIRVTFSLRKISGAHGNISGNVFVVLKKKDEPESAWLVIPRADLEDGTPLDTGRGQYFSIINYKSMSFRATSNEDLDQFTMVGVFVYAQGSRTLITYEEVSLETNG
ncbi:MAG: hypothetical protein V1793_14325 [Pseudomonadota bacterium]